MTQPHRPSPLRLVRDTPSPVDTLLAAFEQWAGRDRGEPAAYLEVGDGELTGEFVLTAAHASQLAALLQASPSPGMEPEGQPRPATAPER